MKKNTTFITVIIILTGILFLSCDTNPEDEINYPHGVWQWTSNPGGGTTTLNLDFNTNKFDFRIFGGNFGGTITDDPEFRYSNNRGNITSSSGTKFTCTVGAPAGLFALSPTPITFTYSLSGNTLTITNLSHYPMIHPYYIGTYTKPSDTPIIDGGF